MRTVARRLPSDPRCKVCYYPFAGLGGRLDTDELEFRDLSLKGKEGLIGAWIFHSGTTEGKPKSR